MIGVPGPNAPRWVIDCLIMMKRPKYSKTNGAAYDAKHDRPHPNNAAA